MSKIGISRSKGDRKNTLVQSASATSTAASAAASAAAVTPVTQDIVPGKFSHHDWLWMLERDESDAFITDIVEEVYKVADKIIYEKYLERQSIPYTVMQLKDELLQIVEWQYLAHDEDASQIDSSLWYQEEEPLAAMTDCWAQGAVPQTFRCQPSISEEADSVSCAGKDQDSRVSDKIDVNSPPHLSAPSPGAGDTCSPVEFEKGEGRATGDICSPVEFEKGEGRATGDTCSPVEFEKGEGCAVQSEPCDVSSPSGKESPFKLAEEPEIVCGIDKLLAANEETSGREPDRKPSITVEASVSEVCQVMFPRSRRSESEDKQPPVTESCISTTERDVDTCFPSCKDMDVNLYLSKIPPNRLPTNRVNTLFCIVDPKHDATKLRTDALKARKKQLEAKTRTQKLASAPCMSICRDKPVEAEMNCTQKNATIRLPLTLDSMQVAPGVTARERDVVKHGPKPDSNRCDIPSDLVLKPVRSHNPHPTVNVSDILDHRICVKPLTEKCLVPPIVCSSPVSSQ